MTSAPRALLCALLSCFVVSGVSAQPVVGPTVKDIVEFTRIVQPESPDDDSLREQVSPDGTHAFIVTRTADVASDENRYEIRLLDLRPDRLAVQQAPRPAVVFSAAIAGDNNAGAPGVQQVRWNGDRTLAFLARLDGGSLQVYRLDLPSRKLRQLTHEKNLIVSYAASQDLRRVVYAVQVPNPPLREGAHEVVVGNRSFWSVKFGQQDLRSQDRMYRYFVADVASPGTPRALGEAFLRAGEVPLVSVSPDGRWALLHRYAPERLAAWEQLYPKVADLSKRFAPSHHVDPLQYFSKPSNYVPRLTTAWRLDDAKEQPIVDAPDDALPGSYQSRTDHLWQGKGESVVLAGTYLPPTQDGKASPSSHIIEYWPDTGRWVDVATLENTLTEAHPLADGFVTIDGAKRREFHRRADGGWRESTSGAALQSRNDSAWTLRLVQSLNQPPDVYAAGPGGEMVRLTWLNPRFDAATWGTMSPYTWLDAAGHQWRGGLMTASGMDSHGKYPLLIQTYGFRPDRFYLDGSNIGEGYTSAYAGRAFLREGFLVLAVPLNMADAQAQPEHQARQDYNEGVRAAVDALVKEGRVDPAKVGIIGFSHYGQRVLNLVIAIGQRPVACSDVGRWRCQHLVFDGCHLWERRDDVERQRGGQPGTALRREARRVGQERPVHAH